MSVYVDPVRPCMPSRKWRGNRACHLLADTVGELHAFAARLGLNHAWFQNPAYSGRGLPHYDLTPGMRARAVTLGAVEVGRDFIVDLPRLCAAAQGVPS